MAVEFYITSGKIEIEKKLFIREMLSPKSLLRSLLNYELSDSDKKRFVTIDKESSQQWTIIDFTAGSQVAVGGDYQNLIQQLKEKYCEKVRGRICLCAFYFYNMTVTLDLDCYPDRLKLITED